MVDVATLPYRSASESPRARRARPSSGTDSWTFDMDGKWKTFKSESLLKDRWIDLRADYCLTPAGQEISPYYVLSYPDWINVVAVTTDGCLVLVRQYRHAAGDFFMEIPGGAVENADSDIEQAARRELQEETGFTARSWELISTLHPNPASHTNRLHTFLAIDATCDHEQRLDRGEEGLSVHAVPIPQVLEGLRSGFIGQALHVSSILLGLTAAGRLG